MEEVVVDSNDILLEEQGTASVEDDESDLARALANTRVVSQDEVYGVEDFEIEEVNQINSFYYTLSNDRTRRLKKTPETEDLFSMTEDSPDPIDLTSITIGELSPEHLAHFPVEEVHRDITPIDPIIYRSTGGNGREQLYFAEVSTDYVVRIHLRNEVGERQTIYKTFNHKKAAEKFTRNVGDQVMLTLQDDQVKIKNVNESEIEESKTDTTQDAEEDSPIQTARPVIYGLLGWVLPPVVYLSVQTYTGINTSFLGLLFILIGLIAAHMLISNHRNSSSNTSTDQSNSSQKEFESPIHLQSPDKFETERDTQEPVSEVTVETSFTGDSLDLTIAGIDESPQWKYKTSDGGVFKDSSIVDFYTQLGFNKSESRQFSAFVSTEKYTDLPRLTSSTGRNNLYLYPEDPR